MKIAASRTTVIVIVAYAVLTVILTHPALWLAATHQLSCCNDPWLFIWTIGWDVHALTTRPWAIFDANIFYPHPNTLAYSEHLIGSAVLVAPIVWLTGNTLLATNIAAISSAFLCALGAYVLGRRLGLSPGGAFLCGLVFGFAPPRLLRIYQLHQTTIQWIPFALAYLHGYFQSNRARDLRLAALFFSLQALTSGHGAAMLTLGGAIVIACHFASGTPLALVRRLRDVGVPGLLALVPSVLVYIPYWRARHDVGLVRELDNQPMSLSSWVSSPSHVDAYLVSLLPDWQWLQMEPDAYLFPGVLPLLIAAMALLVPAAARQTPAPSDKRWWKAGALLLTLLALAQVVIGVLVAIDGRVRWRIGDTLILRASDYRPWIYAVLFAAARAVMTRHVPFAPHRTLQRIWARIAPRQPRGIYFVVLVITTLIAMGAPYGLWPYIYNAPGLSFIRVPSRFALLGLLALGVLVGIGFERMTRRVAERARLGLTVALTILMSVEFAAVPLDVRPYPVEIPAIHKWLGEQPRPFTLATFPVPYTTHKAVSGRRMVIYMLYSMEHFQPIVHGYSGIEPPGYPELETTLAGFPDEASLSLLADLNVTYAAVHVDYYRDEGLVLLETGLERAVRDGWLRLVYQDGDRGRVYTIHHPASREAQ